jgi:hypothetical protein
LSNYDLSLDFSIFRYNQDMPRPPIILQNPLQNPLQNIRALYDKFDAPICSIDCGQKCAPHNPSGKPFCCDICHAVPAAYQEEWRYLQSNTNLWQTWHTDDCKDTKDGDQQDDLMAETPENMLLLTCLGPDKCQRAYRALSCRQFPFFPYVTSDYRFIGMTYDWEFEQTCWVVSNLGAVTETYRRQFVETHDRLFAFSQEAFESYQIHSEKMRAHFATKGRRITLYHRNDGIYLISPGSERMVRVSQAQLRQYGPYKAQPQP